MFLRFYGLREQPFGVTPDPRFLYMGPAQQEAFSSIVYGIETGRGFMALIASPGLGKTTILLQLMERLRESARTALLFETHTNSLEFLRSLLSDLGIDSSSQDLGELQRQLRDVLIQEWESGKRIVVAIDEAQNLDEQILETVRVLSNYETPQAKLLQIVLVGQPQLADKLASPQLEQLRQRVSIITHFPPLDGADIPKYIDHRLRVAGYSGNSLFTPAALRLIVTHSKGIPRNINNLCFQAMSLGYAKNQKRIDDATLREVIADLSLETLGTATPEVPGKIPSDKGAGVGGSRAAAEFGRKTPAPTTGSMPVAQRHDLLLDFDDVDLSSSRRIAQGRNSRATSHRARPLVLFGLLVLLAWLWRGPYLRAGLEYVEQFAKSDGGGPKPEVVTPTSAPPAAVANSLGSQAPPVENPSTLSKEDAPPQTDAESPAPVDSEAPPAVSGEGTSIAPTMNLNTSRTGGRPRTGVRETSPTRADGLPTGSGQLFVESSHSGARITINGESNPKWVTPHLFWLASGTYTVSVSGWPNMTWTRRIHVDEGRKKWVVAELAEQQEVGIFTVDTDPPGMQVFIDGKAFGPSRVETTLRPGWHVCEVIPGPGLKPLVSRFQMQPGGALTRRIRMETPTARAYAP